LSGRLTANGFTTIFNAIEFPKALNLKDLLIIYPTKDDYQESLEISVALLKKGAPLQAVDIMIAAMCIRRNLTLLTKDNDFAQVAKVSKSFRFELTK
jgi:tRNA(fMet)-specific endonuclease VapC